MGDKDGSFVDNHCVVAIVGDCLERDEHVYEKGGNLELGESGNLVDEQLAGVFHHFRIALEEGFPCFDVGFEPGVCLVDFPVEDEGVDNSE